MNIDLGNRYLLNVVWVAFIVYLGTRDFSLFRCSFGELILGIIILSRKMLEFCLVPRLIELRESLGRRLDRVHVLLKMGRNKASR